MAKKTSHPLSWYLTQAINVEATDGLPAGQIFVAYITYDRKLCVQFPNGGQEIYSVKKMNDFASRHGGWVDAKEPSKWVAYHGPWNPLDTDLGGSIQCLVELMASEGMSPEAILEGITGKVKETLEARKK